MFQAIARRGALFLLPILFILTAALPTSAQPNGDGPQQAGLTVEGLRMVAAGETITVSLTASAARDLAAWQATLHFDPAQLHYLGATTPAAVLRLGPALAKGDVALGAVGRTPNTDGPLATITFAALTGGWPQLSLADTLLVTSAGALAADLPAARLDLTGNSVVTQADALRVVDAWMSLRAEGLCIAPVLADRDLNGNGCIDAADAQIALARRTAPRMSVAALPVTYVVNSVADDSDANNADGVCQTSSGVCTLRAAIQQANTHSGPENINFNIRNGDGSCPALVTLQPASTLVIDSVEGVALDGYTQCDASPNTLDVGGNAVIKIELRGPGLVFVHGLEIYSPNTTVRGLAIYNWDRNIYVGSSGASDNLIEGNFLGTNAANDFQLFDDNPTHLNFGLYLYGTLNTTVGGATPAARNIISGNRNDGLHVEGSTTNLRVVGNIVGLKQDGVTPLPNTSDGVDIGDGSHDAQVGGTAPGERNIIGGNEGDGVEISHDLATRNITIAGNYIGVNALGNAPVGNTGAGITLEDTPNHLTIYNNVISGNRSSGINFYWQINDSSVHDNLIGVAPDGVTPMPNSPNGIQLFTGSSRNTISHNVVAFNALNGIYVLDSDTIRNTFSQNSVHDNGREGIGLYDANNNLAAPVITSAGPAQVAGTACPFCLVEVFIADKSVVDDPGHDNYGEGETFVGQGTASANGSFAIALSNVNAGAILTATATDAQGNTSKFSRNVIAANPNTSTPAASLTATASPTATATRTPTASPTATASPTVTATRTPTPTLTPTPIFTPGAVIYASSSTGGTAGGVQFADEDVLTYNTLDHTWAMFFDGSDVGLATTGVDAVLPLADGSMLLSLDSTLSVLGVGTVTGSDVLRFVPTAFGPTTTGSFEMYFQGADVGLTTSAENVDAVAIAPDGRLIMSTSGNFRVQSVSGTDEDLLAFAPTQLGAVTSGAWSLYFDGSDVQLTSPGEDVWGAWIDNTNGDIYLTTQGPFSVTGAGGDGADIFVCHPLSLGSTTACTFGPGLFWDGSANGFAGEVLDGFALGR